MLPVRQRVSRVVSCRERGEENLMAGGGLVWLGGVEAHCDAFTVRSYAVTLADEHVWRMRCAVGFHASL
jgi:hypothetical protein